MDAPTVKLDLLRLHATAADPVGLARQAWAFLREPAPTTVTPPATVDLVEAQPPSAEESAPPRSRRGWTNQDERRCEEMYAAGTEVKVIAAALGRSTGTVSQKIYKSGWTQLYGPRCARPAGAPEAQPDSSPSPVWDEDADWTLTQLVADGKNVVTAAAEMERDVADCEARLAALALAPKADRPDAGPCAANGEWSIVSHRSLAEVDAADAADAAPPAGPRPRLGRPKRRRAAVDDKASERALLAALAPAATATPASGRASLDQVVTWLRSRDFSITASRGGYLVDGRKQMTAADLVAFANHKRLTLDLPPFEVAR